MSWSPITARIKTLLALFDEASANDEPTNPKQAEVRAHMRRAEAEMAGACWRATNALQDAIEIGGRGEREKAREGENPGKNVGLLSLQGLAKPYNVAIMQAPQQSGQGETA